MEPEWTDAGVPQETQELSNTGPLPVFADFPPLERPPRPKKHGSSALLPILGIGGIVLVLVILALLLPPISLLDAIKDDDTSDKSVFTSLNAGSPRIQADGLTIEAADLTGSYGARIVSVSSEDYVRRQTPAEGWSCETSVPGRPFASPVYSLTQTGTPPSRFTLSIVPAASQGTLAMYRWNTTLQTWEFIPSQMAESQVVAEVASLPPCVALFADTESARRVAVILDPVQTLAPDVLDSNVRVYPTTIRPTAAGSLQVVPAATSDTTGTMPVVQNFDDPTVIDVATVQQILGNSALRTEHVQQIAAYILRQDSNFAGVVIDYRDIPADLNDEYVAFLRDLAQLLHLENRTLAVVLPASEGYDWRGIGRAADEVIFDLPLDPAAYAPGGPVDLLLDEAVAQIDRSKIWASLSALSIEEQPGALMLPIALDQALSSAGTIQVEQAEGMLTAQLVPPEGISVQTGREFETSFVRYVDASGSVLRTMWITDPAVLSYRMAPVVGHNIGGVMIRDLFAPGVLPGMDVVLRSYRLNEQADPTLFDSSLRWTVRSGENMIDEESLPLDQPLTLAIPAEATELTIEAQIGSVTLDSQPLTVTAVATATPTTAPSPTPLLTSTPRSTNATLATEEVTADSTEEAPVTVATPAPLDTNAPLPTVDPALLQGMDLGTAFEPGVQIMQPGPISILPAGQTHFVWIKLNVTYHMGDQPDTLQSQISELRANNFKLLLNVTGDPFELANMDGYVDWYAQYVGGLAAFNVEGIEIWREMNAPADRAIAPDAYLRLLAASYVAIKTAHPNTMVISGALIPALDSDDPTAPTNDATYLQALADAGAATYFDCIGAQYLNGAVSPASTSGDPRGDQPIYYLQSMTDRVWSVLGGAKPVCYTSLGYLAAEGYTLPAGYEWAQATTAALQAQWLTEALQEATQSTRIRLMIVWNMDAVAVDDTTTAGAYALIRPGGACPACDALAPLLEPNP